MRAYISMSLLDDPWIYCIELSSVLASLILVVQCCDGPDDHLRERQAPQGREGEFKSSKGVQ